MDKQRGKFIVLDAISGSGKGAQIDLLKKEFPGCYFDFEPGNALYGAVVRSMIERRPIPDDVLVNCFFFGDPKSEFWKKAHGIIRKIIEKKSLTEMEFQILYMADRVYNLEKKYLPKLEKGISVILDRYFYSTLAYGFSGGLDMDEMWDWQMKAFASSKVILDNWKPDLLVIFDLDARTAMERLKSSGKIIDIFEEKLERLNKIREGYKILSSRGDISKKTVIIDASRGIAEIHEEVGRIIKETISSKKSMKIYFAGSIRGGRDDKELYFEIINLLKKYGEVLTEHVGDKNLSAAGEDGLSDEIIYNRDMKLLNESDFVVAEVSTPSLGIGYELGKMDGVKPIMCLFRKQNSKRLSAMIRGNKNMQIAEYQDISDIEKILKDFFEKIAGVK